MVAQSAAVRNRFILESAQRVVFAALDPNGALVRLLDDVRSSRNVAFEVLSGIEGGRIDTNGL